jgi:hypothetical protein
MAVEELHVARNSANTIRVDPRVGYISAVLYSNSGMVPLKERPYKLAREGGPELSGTTTAEGEIAHAAVPIGDYLLEIDGSRCYVPTVLEPDEKLQIRVRKYYLVPEQEPPRQPESGRSQDEDPDTSDWDDFDLNASAFEADSSDEA